MTFSVLNESAWCAIYFFLVAIPGLLTPMGKIEANRNYYWYRWWKMVSESKAENWCCNASAFITSGFTSTRIWRKLAVGSINRLVHFQTTVFRVDARQFLFSSSPPGKFYRLSLPIKEKLTVNAFVGYWCENWPLISIYRNIAWRTLKEAISFLTAPFRFYAQQYVNSECH